MTTFLQLHLLTTYPASNLNRDDTGSPKSLKFGGAERLRVSSQSLKRAIRTSDLFATAMGEALGKATPSFEAAGAVSLGIRTKSLPAAIVAEALKLNDSLDRARVAEQVLAALAKAAGKDDEDSTEDAEAAEEPTTAGKKAKKGKKSGKLVIGSLDPKRELETREAVHVGPDEYASMMSIAKSIAEGKAVDPKAITLLLEKPKAADIAMFGRMLADSSGYNVEAAVQVAHAFTTHRAAIEDDYYTAVDDLKNKDRTQDRGAGFIGIQEYGAGVFYLYICIDADLLVANLSGEKTLAASATRAFIEAAATVSPRGKQNSYASRARASYAMLEVGPEAPRTLAAAFLRPIRPEDSNGDVGRGSITALETLREQFATAYGLPSSQATIMDVTKAKPGEPAGTLAEILKRAEETIHAVTA